METMNGRNISGEELRDLCSRVSDEHSFRMMSLAELAELPPRRTVNKKIPTAIVAGTDGSDYASV